ncbi:type III-D CRISPR-associated protein Csx19 [Bacillus smithii]|uniref:type III-D CRISPR-associated protein Csx19 n=1 Tax=Bacillus smithii TaxID=1479 RepID=UPI0030C90E16
MPVRQITSSSERVSFSLGELKKGIRDFFKEEKGFILAWLDYEVKAGFVSQGEMIFYDHSLEEEYLQELRVFNEKRELHVRRWEEQFVGRMIVDGGDGEYNDIFDEKHYIWGQVVEGENGWLKVSEKNRGFQIYIPSLSQQDVPQKICYYVRNYLKEDDDGQLFFDDARICGFCKTDMTFLILG